MGALLCELDESTEGVSEESGVASVKGHKVKLE